MTGVLTHRLFVPRAPHGGKLVLLFDPRTRSFRQRVETEDDPAPRPPTVPVLEWHEAVSMRGYLARTWFTADQDGARSVPPPARESVAAPPAGLVASSRLP